MVATTNDPLYRRIGDVVHVVTVAASHIVSDLVEAVFLDARDRARRRRVIAVTRRP